jgi:hypothetical protein
MLQFNPDGSFTIAQFTDLHCRNGEFEDLETTRVMSQVLDSEKPDLVVLTGDVIDGSYCQDPLQAWNRAVQTIVDRNLPWAAVFGNHDDEGSASRSDLMTNMLKLPGCLADRGLPGLSGIGNYVLEIGGSTRLYFLDSHGYADRGRKKYDWVKQDQIDWYHRQPHDRPALMFFHIPLPEYDQVWNTGQCTGSKFEPVCGPEINSGLFAALKTGGDVRGVFVGHDHTNDFAGELDGIHLCYGRATGFASYGRAGFPRGGRIIRLTEGKKDFETWVRLDTR